MKRKLMGEIPGANEPVQFTRGDAERIARLEEDVCHVKKMTAKIMYVIYTVGVSTIFWLAGKVITLMEGH